MASKMLVLTSIILILMLPLPARPEDKVSFTFSSKVWTGYLLNGSILHDDPVLQNVFTVSFPKGFYMEIFQSMGFDKESNLADEIDVTIGWNTAFKSFGITAAISYLNLTKLSQIPEGDALQFQILATKPWEKEMHIISPYVLALGIIPLKTEMGGKGAYVFAGIAHIWQIHPRISIRNDVSIFYDTGIYGLDNGTFTQYAGSLSIPVHKNFSLDLISIKASQPLLSISDGRGFEIVAGTGFTLTF